MVKDCFGIWIMIDDMYDFLKSAANTIFKSGLVQDGDAFYRALLAREEEITTGVGRGVAFPHAYGDFIDYPLFVYSEPKNTWLQINWWGTSWFVFRHWDTN